MSELASLYFVTPVTLERATRNADDEVEVSDYGETAYEAPVTVYASYEPAEGQIRSATGEEIDASGRVQLAEEVRPGDRINGREVRSVEIQDDHDGSIAWYDARL